MTRLSLAYLAVYFVIGLAGVGVGYLVAEQQHAAADVAVVRAIQQDEARLRSVETTADNWQDTLATLVSVEGDHERRIERLENR